MRLVGYWVSLWCLVRLARFGSRLVGNHLFCPIICTVWFCLTCLSGFGLIPHAMSSSRDAFATFVPRRSGTACPVGLPIVSVIDASYVTDSWVIGVGNAGWQGLDCDCCDSWGRWRLVCWSLTKSSRAFSFVFASVWTTNTRSRRFSNLSGSGSDLQRQSKRWAVRDIAFHRVQALVRGSWRRWPCAVCR